MGLRSSSGSIHMLTQGEQRPREATQQGIPEFKAGFQTGALPMHASGKRVGGRRARMSIRASMELRLPVALYGDGRARMPCASL